jgi:hypothetical protein
MKRKHILLLGAAVAISISSPLITWFVFNRPNDEQTYWVDMRGARPLLSVVGADDLPRRFGLASSSSFLLRSSRNLPEWPSREDIAQVRRAVRDDLWHRVFPSMSWRTLQEAPHSLLVLASCRIKEVTLHPGEMVQVRMRSCFGECFSVLVKGKPLRPKGPTIAVPLIGSASPAEPKQRPLLAEAAAAKFLSNHVTLTFGH